MPGTRSSKGAGVAALVAVVVVALAFLAGRSSAPADRTARVSAGVPVGYEHSRAGAEAAALQYATTRARALLLPAKDRLMVLRTIGTERWSSAADREDGARDLAPLAEQERANYLAAGVGSKTSAYSDGRATIVTWMVQAFSGGPSLVTWHTQVIDVVWQDGDWKIDGQRDARTQAVPQSPQKPRMADTRDVMLGLHAPVYGRP